MKHALVVAACCLVSGAVASAETLVFRDGGRLEVLRFEVRDDVVVLTGADGRLRSLPRESVDLVATRRANQVEATSDVPIDMTAMVAEASELVGLRRLSREICRSAHRLADGARRAGSRGELVLVEALAVSFDEDRSHDVMSSAFRPRATDLRLRAALSWLRSSEARRIAELERAGDAPEAFARYLSARRPVPRSRLALVRRLDRAMRVSERSVDVQTALMRAILEGFGGALPEDAASRFAARSRDRAAQSLLYRYRSVPDEEIERYLLYLESENGLWLSGIVSESLLVAIEDAAERASELIVERLAELAKTKA